MRHLTALLIGALLALLPRAATAGEIVINAVGDIMLAGRWVDSIREKGYDHPFSGVTAELAKGDINLANLESPIALGGSEFTSKQFRFRAEPHLAPALAKAGFNLVNLANNHIMDFGEEALAETLLNLEAAGIGWVGAGKNLDDARRMALCTVKGARVAFLGYSFTRPVEFYAAKQRPGTAPGWEALFVEDIARARSEAEYVIVSFHWGREGSDTAQPYQRTAAHRAIEAGADAVIGHHPHVLQGVERYNNGIIFYSLGNFAFASRSRTSTVGALVRLRLNGKTREAEILPLDVRVGRGGFQPRLLSGTVGAEVIESLNGLSKPFKTAIQSRDGRFVIDF